MAIFDRVATMNGKLVGFSLYKRGKVYLVKFNDRRGLYVKRSTGQTREDLADVEARRIIEDDHNPPKATTTAKPWHQVIEELRRALTVNNNQEETFISYRNAIERLRDTVTTDGPADIDLDKAKAFKTAYLTGTYKRSEAKDAKTYKRSESTFNNLLRHLRSLWNKWLDLRTANPWKEVPPARPGKRKPKAPGEDNVMAFIGWVQAKYPGWELPILFLKTKAFLGCRLHDICAAKSEDLRDNTLTLHDRKDGTSHTVAFHAAPDLFQALDALKGPVYLWEAYTEELRAFLTARKQKTRVLGKAFTVEAFYWFIASLFRDYNREHPESPIRSHDFRKRAVTLGFKAGVRAEVLAQRIGMNPATLIKWYLDLAKATKKEDFGPIDRALAIV